MGSDSLMESVIFILWLAMFLWSFYECLTVALDNMDLDLGLFIILLVWCLLWFIMIPWIMLKEIKNGNIGDDNNE